MTRRGKSAKNPAVQIPLSCHHDASYRSPQPHPGEIVWCRRCMAYKTVTGQQFQYTTRCNDCRLSRTHGQDITLARLSAMEHLRKRPAHAVTIYAGSREIETVTYQGIQEGLPGL